MMSVAQTRIFSAIICFLLIWSKFSDSFPIRSGVSTTRNVPLVAGNTLPLHQQRHPLFHLIPHSTFSTIRIPPSRSTGPPSTALGASILSHTLDTIRTFSPSSGALQSVTDRALQTPPIVYFLALMAAGVGVPVSEDALCLFAGTVYKTLEHGQKIRLLLCLYLGVVLSDVVTFWLGRALRLGVLEPLRESFLVGHNATVQEEMAVVSVEAVSGGANVRKRDKIRNVMERAGDWVGFVIRFSVGMRGPLMLLTGFTNRVSFVKFLMGTSVGACITVPLQLWVGYTLGHRNPAAVVGIVGGISTFVLVGAAVVGIASWGTLLISQLQKRRKRAKHATS